MTKGVVFISGGTRGLGLELLKTALNEGHQVATFARSETPELNDLIIKNPDKILFRQIDIQNTTEVKSFINHTCESFGEISCLVNNAAIGQDNLLCHLGDDNIDSIIAINLVATIKLTKLVVKKILMSSKPGKIINISSICGTKGLAGLSVYSATKGALDAFSRSLAVELGERQIVVNSISPGFFSSDLSAVLSKEQIGVIKRRTPLRDLCDTKDVASVFKFLLTNNNKITGQVFNVDGGFSI